MIDIAAHITNLLGQKELVILPNIGGFLLRNHSASIHHTQHQVVPPGAHVVFNAALCDNDGVLAHRLSEQEGLDYKEALEALHRFADLCKIEMQKGHSILFEQMGVLSLNSAQKLNFMPFEDENHARSCYALPHVTAAPILRREPTMVQLDKAVPKEIKTQGRNIRRVAAIALPLLAVSLVAYQWLPLRDTYKATMSLWPNATPNELVVEAPTVAETHDIDYFCAEVAALSAAKVAAEKAVPQGAFHVIGGVFKTEQRVQKCMQTLQDKGFEPYVAGQTGKGMYRVAVANFQNKREALQQLRQWQADTAPDWWLFERSLDEAK